MVGGARPGTTSSGWGNIGMRVSGHLKHFGARICPGVRLVSPSPSDGPEIRRRTSEEGAESSGVGVR